MTRFAADGYQLLLIGHTHGGQLCIPFYGALVTNCGIDRARVKGLSHHDSAWLHVSMRPRHLPLRPGPLRLLPGGHPADPRTPALKAVTTTLEVR